MKSILIKTPVGKENDLIQGLSDIFGIRAGTDGFYEDPSNFVSVIVHLPDISDLEKFASECGAELIREPETKLVIEMDMGNAAFEDNPEEVYDVLQKVSMDIANGFEDGKLFDSNGNSVGRFKVVKRG